MRERDEVLRKFQVGSAPDETHDAVAMADRIRELEALAAACSQGLPGSEAPATRVRVVDEWRVVTKNGQTHSDCRTREKATEKAEWLNKSFAWVNHAPFSVVRVALVDADASGGNDPETPESSERVSNAYQLPDTVQAIVDAAAAYEKKHGPWQDYRMSRRDEAFPVDKTERAIIVAYRKHTALTAALEVPRDR